MKIAAIKPRVDWVAFARSVGAEGITVEEPSDLIAAYKKAYDYIKKSNNRKPFLIDVICDNRYPTPNTSTLSKLSEEISRSVRAQKRVVVHGWHS